MVKETRIYVEGGGSKESKALMRRAFGRFLSELGPEAWDHEHDLQIVACGSREATYEKFLRARNEHPNAFNLLLVDSDGPVEATPRQHLTAGGWKLGFARDEQVHLMVQAMEAWLIADPDTLARFYDQGFAPGALPRTQNVENIPKNDLLPALKRATRGTSKGEYHKTRHAFELLARIDPRKVRRRAPHCDLLFATIHGYIAS
ncbi:MAG TPA: DUF4276 family protein [Longimicrobium sp.]|jgi:hypothetical protein